MVVKYKQDNELSILLEPIQGVVSVSVGLWIKSGSRNEKEDQYGYAHFVEHMLFKGTEKYSAKDIAKIVDRVGGQHNAATNREFTCYYINVISDYLELAIDILSDMYYNSVFDKGELEKEKNVIIEEIKMYEDTPDEYIHDLFMESMFSGHPLSHSILGTLESIKETSRNTLLDFYQPHYKNSNAIFVIAGNFIESDARKLIAKYFSRNCIANPLQVLKTDPKPVVAYNKHIHRELEQVHFCLGIEGINREDKDRWALYALSTILGGSMSSRLFQNIREKEGISYSIYSFHSSYSDAGIFGIYCATSPDYFKKAFDLIVNECRTILHNNVTSDELQDAKTFMKGNLALSMESVEVRMAHLAKNEITHGRYYSFDDMFKDIDNITMDDFDRISKRLFANKKLSIISLGKLSNGIKDIENNLQI